jgi:hypothetical protein
MTGRGLGYCRGAAGGYSAVGGFGGRRGGGGLGMGRGWRHRNWAPDGPGRMGVVPGAGWGRWRPEGVGPSAEEDLLALRQVAADLEDELARVRARLEELAPPIVEEE